MKYLALFISIAVAISAGCNNSTEGLDNPSSSAANSDSSAPANDSAGFKFSAENAMIAFKGSKPDGSSHVGGFKSFSGSIDLDETSGTVSSIHVSIDTDSLFSDAERLTGHLKNVDFFNVNEFPTAEFVSTSVTAADGQHTIKGNLTLLGKTAEIEFPATISTEAGKVTLESQFSLDRTKFGMTYGTEKNEINPNVDMTIAVGRTE